MNPENRNLFLAVALSIGVLLLYQVFYAEPTMQAERARVLAASAASAAKVPAQVPGAPAPAATTAAGVSAGSATVPAVAATAAPQTRAAAIAASARVPFDGPGVDGSISLVGGRVDDLRLKRYRVTIDKSSPEVTLLDPQFSGGGYYAFFGWSVPVGAPAMDLPGPNTLWTLASGTKLTPQTPVTLTYTNPAGLTFTRSLALDDNYVFTVSDKIKNAGAAPAQIAAYGALRRHGLPKLENNQILHEGMVGMFNSKLVLDKYKDLDKGKIVTQPSTGGWFGVTDKYWLTALIPDQKETVDATFRTSRDADGGTVYEASWAGTKALTIAPGGTIEHTQRLFAGAKKVSLLQAYDQQLGIERFEDAVDWGNFWFLTKPFFLMMSTFEGWLGTFALAILLTTVVVKVATFPLVYKGYEGMAKMRAVGPKMKEVQERFAADKQRQQQEVMKLYQTEKINPLAGCVPMLIPIPIFYALYKVLTVALEMRHAPFYGWIHDLAARDPTTIFNLFGLLPYDPTSWPLIGTFLAVGVWPILYGLSLWLVQSMQPAATDPMQQQIMMLLPFLFTFLFAGFAAGLVIYWTWSNILTIAQQYVIMHRMKTENPIDTFLEKIFGKKAASA